MLVSAHDDVPATVVHDAVVGAAQEGEVQDTLLMGPAVLTV